MRRIAVITALIAFLTAGCDTAGPMDSTAAAPANNAARYDGRIMMGSGTTASLPNDEPAEGKQDSDGGIMMGSGGASQSGSAVQNDSTAPTDVPAEGAGGIMIGSGT
jgi:hypothetical protein